MNPDTGRYSTLCDASRAHYDGFVRDPADADQPRNCQHKIPPEEEDKEKSDGAEPLPSVIFLSSL
jgi:hypothetical protein